MLDKYGVDNYDIESEITDRVPWSGIDMSLLEEYFSFDVRCGLIAGLLSYFYECFPPDTRRSDFLKFVDAINDIDLIEIQGCIDYLIA